MVSYNIHTYSCQMVTSNKHTSVELLNYCVLKALKSFLQCWRTMGLQAGNCRCVLSPKMGRLEARKKRNNSDRVNSAPFCQAFYMLSRLYCFLLA